MKKAVFSPSLNTQIFVGAAIGIILGILFNGRISHPFYEPVFYSADILGGIFINLLKMILLPLIFTSVTIGIANLRAHGQINRVWRYTLVYFLSTPVLAAVIGLAAVNFFAPGKGLNIEMFHNTTSTFTAQSMSLPHFFQTFVLSLFVNPIKAMAEGNVMAVVVLALFLGIAFIKAGSRSQTLLNVLAEIFEIIMMVVGWIMRLAPLGIMALLAKLIMTQDLNLLPAMGKYMTIVMGTTLFHGIVVLPAILYFFTGVSPLRFFNAIKEAMVTAFSTSSSSVTMPVTLRCVEENLGVDKNIAGFVVPLGTTVNMDGTAMYEAIAALFVANLVGIDLNIFQQIIVLVTSVIASIGAPGIPSAGMVTMIMVLQSVGLPVEAIAILLPIDRPLDTVRTMVNVEGDAVGSLIVQKLVSRNNLSNPRG